MCKMDIKLEHKSENDKAHVQFFEPISKLREST